MSKFLSNKYAALTPYVPGEQPKDMQYIKLNTNESPFEPPMSALNVLEAEVKKLQLYSDPECTVLVEKVAQVWGIKKTQVIMSNGSDEILNFAFMAFGDKENPFVFPDLTYGFYTVFADLNGVPYEKIPLKEDFTIDYHDYLGIEKNIVIANPNAPTGLTMPRWQIEEILKSNPNHVVVIDEAYVDFGGESCVSLIDKYDNLLVTQTFSKSRSLAGGRLGMGFACEKLMADLNTIKYSTNPYNVNRLTAAVGYAILCEEEWFKKGVKTICENRAYTAQKLKDMGFEVLDSNTNFVFAKTEKMAGETLYLELKKRGILVRHFKDKRIAEYNRITIGTKEQMDVFLKTVEEILQGVSK